jgi:predicted negative regulator of RcsB-dependent stress response
MNTTTSNSTTNATPEVDRELAQTEFGEWIVQNKAAVISAVLLIFVGIFGYGIFNHLQTKKHNEYASSLYNMVDTKLADFKAKKIDAAALKSAVNTTWEPMGGFAGAAPFIIQVADALAAEGNYQEAYDLVAAGATRISNRETGYFFNIRAAAFAESLDGQTDAAIGHLKDILASGSKYFEGKIYLDLGRLYLKKKDTKLAKDSFQWVVDNGAEEEFKRMASIYLSEL